MPGTSPYKECRAELMRLMKKGSIALIASAPEHFRNRDVEYPYRQDSDFYRLTGFNEPDSVAVFIPGRTQGEFILFCREYDPEKAVWIGKNAGLEGAKEEYGADESFPITELSQHLPDLLKNRERVYYPVGGELDQGIMVAVRKIKEKIRTGAYAPHEFISLEHILHKMRMTKTPHELLNMRRAIDVSVAAHIRAMKSCRPGMFEYEIEAELTHEFVRNGLRFQAYPSIVAGGKNACVLHYTKNCDCLYYGDLLLVDAGAECDHCAADITRTFPVNGKFTEPQALLYQLVLDTQLAVIALVHPGTPWGTLQNTAELVITEGLVRLGLLKGNVDELIKQGAFKKFFMHRIGHWLGHDVHDVGNYKDADGEWIKLKPWMMLTVEPGIYVQRDDMSVDEKWRGIGIRIEDDVLVTKDGYIVLSATVPKEIDEIENLMRG